MCAKVNYFSSAENIFSMLFKKRPYKYIFHEEFLYFCNVGEKLLLMVSKKKKKHLQSKVYYDISQLIVPFIFIKLSSTYK